MMSYIESLVIFISTLFLLCQNVQTKDRTVRNTLELNKEILSETNIFYLPGSQVPVPLLSKASSVVSATKDRGPKGVYGWLPCFCLIGVCNCCVDIQIRALSIRDTGCVTVSPSNEDSTSIETELSLNNKTLIQERISFDDPVPLCNPFPAFIFLSGCIHFNKIRTHNGRIKGCARMEIRVTATDIILWDMQFSCFRIGTDGIVFNKPHGNKGKPGMGPEKPTSASH